MTSTQSNISRWLAIALCVAIFIALALPIKDNGLYAQCPWPNRFSYHFFHASFFHCAINAWCLLSIVFFYSTPAWQLLLAFAIAAAVPPQILSATPTIGLSGICFALLGIVSFSVAKPWQLFSWIAFYLFVGFILPGINAWLHLFCYIAGLSVGFISTPLGLWTRLMK